MRSGRRPSWCPTRSREPLRKIVEFERRETSLGWWRQGMPSPGAPPSWRRGPMPQLRRCRFGVFSLIILASTATGEVTASQTPPLMDREKEIALALSACPPVVATGAAVYVLEKDGYVKVRESQNGFTAIVQHSLPTSREPRCMDAEGTRTHLPRILKVAELRAEGKSRDEIKRFVAEGFASGLFKPPSRPGVDYMLSTENLVTIDEEKGTVVPFPPHVMFYAPYLTNADLGSDGKPDAPAFVAGEGPHALIIVPVGNHAAPHPQADQGKGAQ